MANLVCKAAFVPGEPGSALPEAATALGALLPSGMVLRLTLPSSKFFF